MTECSPFSMLFRFRVCKPKSKNRVGLGVRLHALLCCLLLFNLKVDSIMELEVIGNSIDIERLQLRHENTWQSTLTQRQLKGNRCLSHDLCAIFIGFTQRDNCAIAIVNIIKTALVSEFIVQPTTLATQTRKITEITKNKQRDVQLIYGRDVTCNCSYTLSMLRGASLAKSITVRSTEVAAPLCPNYCTKSWDLLCRYWCTHKAEWRLPDCDP